MPLYASAQLTSFGETYDLGDIVAGILNVVWIAFEAIAIVMFVIAGIMFLTAQGEASKLQTARSAVIWGVAGVVVGIVAYGIIGLIQGIL